MKQEKTFEVRDLRETPLEIRIGEYLINKGISSIEQIDELFEPGFYAVIPIEILEKKTISANAKLLYAEIMALSKKSGRCYATNEYLAERLGLSKATIPSLLRELKDDMLVRVEIKRSDQGTFRDITLSLIGNRGYDQTARGGIAKGQGQKRYRQIDIDKEKKGSSLKKTYPLKKKRYYQGMEMRYSKGRWWCLPADGSDWLEFNGVLEDTIIK